MTDFGQTNASRPSFISQMCMRTPSKLAAITAAASRWPSLIAIYGPIGPIIRHPHHSESMQWDTQIDRLNRAASSWRRPAASRLLLLTLRLTAKPFQFALQRVHFGRALSFAAILFILGRITFPHPFGPGLYVVDGPEESFCSFFMCRPHFNPEYGGNRNERKPVANTSNPIIVSAGIPSLEH